MHIPDGFLDAKTLITTNAISLTALYAAVKKVNNGFSPDKIPLMGVLASFVFAAQLLAFPVIGETLTGKNAARFRQSLGYIFQNPDDQLFMPTVYEDVAFGPENMGYSSAEVETAVRTALSAVELPGYGDKSSHHLSSGEKKRVALATVLSMTPDILILDEPSTNLDPHSRRRLMELLTGMDITQIIAGHDLELILDLCDRVLIFNQGKVITDGAPAELFADANLMEQNFLEVPYSLR